MTRTTFAHSGALLVAAAAIMTAAPAAAETPGSCAAASPSPKPARKKFGLGGLVGAAKSSGLLGSVAGAARGDGNLEADVTGAATRAAGRAAEAALSCAGDGAPGAARAGGESDAATPAAPARQAAGAGPSYPSKIPAPPTFAAAKRAYDEFGKVDCMECEGGFAFDGWPAYPRDEFERQYNGAAQRLGSWPVGHVHRWQGNQSRGTLTVVGEETVSGFRCRTLLFRLTKGNASAERPGLLCWGRANQFAGKESWNEVY